MTSAARRRTHERPEQPEAPALGSNRRLGEHLAAARSRALLSRSKLGARLEVSEETIRRWERGGACPSAEHLARLIAVLSLDEGQFSTLRLGTDELPALASRLRHERAQRAITQAEAGQLLGVAQPTFAGWELGRATPGRQYAPAIAAFLGIDRNEVASLAGSPFLVDASRWSPPAQTRESLEQHETPPPGPDRRFGEHLAAARSRALLSRSTLAERLEIDEETIRRWERGDTQPSPEHLARLIAVLSLDEGQYSTLRVGTALLETPRRSLLGETQESLEQLEASPLESNRRLGEQLAAARSRALLSRSKLAARLEVSEETIRRWERGGACPSAEHLARLIAVLSLDEGQFSTLRLGTDELPALASRLRHERAQRAITQAEAGQLLGVAQPTYAGWELARATPGRQYVPAIASFLGIDRKEVASMVGSPFLVDTSRWPPLGQLIGDRRQSLCLTRGQLATSLGVAKGTVVAWELGYRRPRLHQLRALAAAIEVGLEQLEATLPSSEPELPQLGHFVHAHQRRLGLRLGDLAERADVDNATLSRWIHGHHEPQASSLGRLADALEVPLPLLCEAAGVTSG